VDYRVILYHKHPTSARTRFLKFGNGSVIGFDSIAVPATLREQGSTHTAVHPATVARDVEQRLHLEQGILKADGKFSYSIDAPDGNIQIVLLEISGIDPPIELAERIGGGFIELLEARDFPQIELDLLRKAYEFLLGG
jgi:hypothetical protein